MAKGMKAPPIRVSRGPLRWWLKLWGFDGMCLPPLGIFILAEHVDHPRLRRHEMRHWEQAREMGALRFYATYLWYAVRYGYRNNPLELDACRAERP